MITPLNALLEEFNKSASFKRISDVLVNKTGPVCVPFVPLNQAAFTIGALSEGVSIVAVPSERIAEDISASLKSLLGDENVLYFPLRETPMTNAYGSSKERARMRLTVLTRLLSKDATPLVIVAGVESLMQRLAPKDVLVSCIRKVSLGDEIEPRTLFASLMDAGYEVVDLVEGAGQAALRGDILDVFPLHTAKPYRIEFFGDEVDRIGIYDTDSQRTNEQVKSAYLTPATEAPQDAAAIGRALRAIGRSTDAVMAKGFDAQRIAWEEGRACPGAETLLPVLHPPASLLSYLPSASTIFALEPTRLYDAAVATHRLFLTEIENMLARGEGITEQSELYSDPDLLFEKLSTDKTVLISELLEERMPITARHTIEATPIKKAPVYQAQSGIAPLAKDISAWKKDGYRVLLFAGAQASRLHTDLLGEKEECALVKDFTRIPEGGECCIYETSLESGAVLSDEKLIVLAQSELFPGLAQKSKSRRRGKQKRDKLVYAELKKGDLIVHEVHGIGRFLGVEALTVDDNTRDYLLLEYASEDKLYIPTDQLDRVQKYIGAGGADDESMASMRLSKLGSREWQKQVGRAKSALKELAFDLSELYAKRSKEEGHAFAADSEWQKKLEDNFPHEETPDQLESITKIKEDMENTRPMDRLLCGDVGYGKTEVALRAAFKAVQDSKQVAVLVPTTILAAQHYQTFTKRYDGFPVNIALLSRFRTPKEQKAVREGLKDGQIDIVIGTHAILSDKVKFKDLGLLVVDEEQRFGVGHKEKIKALKTNIDVLTLTATPIPRTLHMSMVGIRDMSVIDTPPEERYPVQTFVMEYTDTLLADAINKELRRGGQSYIICNRVAEMGRIHAHVSSLLPKNARVAYAHGQMGERELENTMLAFLEAEIDVLICSTIVENGLDISNANTLFVLDADRMGLSQLYQLRGRVGRSTRLGYAYFTFKKDKTLSEIASKRLQALSEFTRFGAGFQIALRDLQIRGAGSLLGAKQHGHIADIGYEYYCKLMDDALKEAKGEEVLHKVDTVLDIPIDAHIPRDYIRSEVLRLEMYKRIALISDRDTFLDVRDELIDRYGAIPEPVNALMELAVIKSFASHAQVANLSVTDGSAKLVFSEEATLDGGKLLAVIYEFGARLLPGKEQTTLLYTKERADALAIAKNLPEFLSAIVGCVD